MAGLPGLREEISRHVRHTQSVIINPDTEITLTPGATCAIYTELAIVLQTGDEAMSDMFGKIIQNRTSMTINSSDTSFTKSTQLDAAIPASKIAALSSGEFIGIVADNPDQKIKLKMFHNEIQNDHQTIYAAEEGSFKSIPIIRRVSPVDVMENHQRIKQG